MNDASRSMAECAASVRIATDPVTTPATTFSAISSEFDAIDSPAARVLRRSFVSFRASRSFVISASRSFVIGAPRGRSSSSGLEPVAERARRAPAMADRVLLVRRQLGHRAAVVVVVGHEGRVVAEPAVAARLGRELAAATALEQPFLAVVGHVDECAYVGDAAVLARC